MITAQLASIPSRAGALARTIRSLLPQVDLIRVWLCGYEVTPKCVMNPKVVVMGRADLGDAGKFVGTHEGYVLTCDDDLEYTPGYAEHMIEAVERYGRKAVVSLHGRRLLREPSSYYRDKQAFARFHNQNPLASDERVDVPGTGVMAYHTDGVRFSISDFPDSHRNMADLHAGLKCAKESVPVYCIAHTGREVVLSPLVNHAEETIFARHYRHDPLHTEIVRRIWRVKSTRIAA